MSKTWNTKDYLDHPSIDDGRYIVLSCLGSGGMGAVFHAYDQRLQTYRAIKVLKPELVARQDVRQRFNREAVSMAQLNHPHVVQIFDYGQESLTTYIVMEYIPGNSLQSHLDQFGKLNRAQALSICLQVARGLMYIHDEGFVHRDIKPANILLSSVGAKIADFGLVRSELDQFKTHSAAVMGTFAFMSPEQRLGAKNAGQQTDIYALTASLYMMLTLENPVDLHREEERTKAIADLDVDIQRLINKGMHQDLSTRYSSCKDLTSDLEKLILSSGKSSLKELSKVHSEMAQQDLDKLLRIWKQYTTVGYQSPNANEEDLFASTILPTEEDGKIEDSIGELTSQEENQEKTRDNESAGQMSSTEDTSDDGNLSSDQAHNDPTASTGNNKIKVIGGLICTILMISIVQWVLALNQEQQKLRETRQRLNPLVKLSESELASATKAEQALMNMRYSQAFEELTKLKEPLNRLTLQFALRVIKHKEYRLDAPIRFDDFQAELSSVSEQELSPILLSSTEAKVDWESMIKVWRTQSEKYKSPLMKLIMLSSITRAPQVLQDIELQRVRQLFPSLAIFDHWKQLSRVHQRDKNYINQLFEFEAKYPKAIGFQFEQACVAFMQGKLDLAKDKLKRILQVDGLYNPARALLAKIHIDQGNEQQRLSQLMSVSGDQASPEDQLAYLYVHGRDLIDYGRYHEADKIFAFCVAEAKKYKNDHAALECVQYQILSYLWRGRLRVNDSLFEEYTSLISNAGLDEQSQLYFNGMQLYIRAHLALNRDDIDTFSQSLEQINMLPQINDFNAIKELISYVKNIGRLDRDSKEQLKKVWLKRKELSSSESKCLMIYADSLWAKQLNEPKHQKDLLSKIISRDCNMGILREHLVVEAQLSLLKLLIDQQEVEKALQIKKSLMQSWRGSDQDLAQYPKLKIVLNMLNSIEK